MRFHTTILQAGKTATGIQIPDEVVAALGSGRRPAVTVTINGYTYRSTVAVVNGVKGGDQVEVEIRLDTAPREITVPADFGAALDAEPTARRTFDALSYSNKSFHVLPITGAKTDETRQRRIAKSVAVLREGRPR